MKVIVLFLAFSATALSKVSYYGFKMFEVVPKTQLQLNILKAMHLQSRSDDIDFWIPPRGLNIPVQISVPPSSSIIEKFEKIGFQVEMVMENIQHNIDQQNSIDMKYVSRSAAAQFDYGRYHNLSEIDAWITNITSVYSSIAKVIEVGKSYEGRPIKLIEIDTGKVKEKNAGFFMEAGIHPREWIAPATLIYMTGQMLDLYGKDAKVTDIVDSYTWYILPVFNVDGYEYTWTTDRNWRKTRSKQAFNCYGVDANRNWNWEWCSSGASKDPCADTYCGPSPFSEVEVKAVSDFIDSHIGTIKAFIDFHSYSQFWLTPWGYTKQFPADYEDQNAGAKAACDALQAVYGTTYQHGSTSNIITDVAGGLGADWAYGTNHIKYSYDVELRDKGRYGFLLPADQIIPSGKETLEALKALCTYVYHH